MYSVCQPALVQTVKRTAELVMDKGGYIRKVESLGTRALPSRMSARGLRHSEGRWAHRRAPVAIVRWLSVNYRSSVRELVTVQLTTLSMTIYLRGSAFGSAAEPKVGWFSTPTKKQYNFPALPYPIGQSLLYPLVLTVAPGQFVFLHKFVPNCLRFWVSGTLP